MHLYFLISVDKGIEIFSLTQERLAAVFLQRSQHIHVEDAQLGKFRKVHVQ